MKSFPESLRTRLARSSRIKILVSKSKKSTKRIFKMSSVRGFCEVENIYQHIHKYDTYKSGISFPQSSTQPRNDKQQFSSNKNKKQINKQTQSNPTHVHIHRNKTGQTHPTTQMTLQVSPSFSHLPLKFKTPIKAARQQDTAVAAATAADGGGEALFTTDQGAGTLLPTTCCSPPPQPPLPLPSPPGPSLIPYHTTTTANATTSTLAPTHLPLTFINHQNTRLNIDRSRLLSGLSLELMGN